MKRNSFFSKILICITAASMAMFLMVGCGSSTAGNNGNGNSTNTAQKSNRFDPAQMKKRMQDNIQPLISNGTITQAQADKIIEAMTNRPAGNRQNNSQNGSQSNQQNNGQSNQQNNNQGGQQNRQRTNPLSKLVSDGVITQAQADAVMQKIQGNFGNRNRNQSQQNTNQQPSK